MANQPSDPSDPMAPMDALGDPTRRAIFERLREGPSRVGELARGLPVTRPAVSQHLRVLREAGLVRDERVGTSRIYRLDPHGLDALRRYLDAFWTEALEQFREAAERDETAERERGRGERERRLPADRRRRKGVER